MQCPGSACLLSIRILHSALTVQHPIGLFLSSFTTQGAKASTDTAMAISADYTAFNFEPVVSYINIESFCDKGAAYQLLTKMF